MASSETCAIRICGLRKIYRAANGPPKEALKGVDLAVPRGSIFGLLGPNGAGKSTLINILAGLVIKTSGKARIWDFDLDENPRMARASIGVVPQELNLDPFFTPREALEFQAGLYGVPRAQRRTLALLDALGLADKADAYARSLSGGMRRRLLVAKAMAHSPPILVLDEPTAGVDVALRARLWDYVRKLHAEGATIVLTTHYLEEAQALCDQIAIINNGALIACEDTATLLSRRDAKRLTLTPETPLREVPPTLARLDLTVQIDDRGRVAIDYAPSRSRLEDVFAALRDDGVAVRDVSTQENDLEDVFLDLTRDAAEEAEEERPASAPVSA